MVLSLGWLISMNELKKEDRRKLFHLSIGLLIALVLGMNRIVGMVFILVLIVWGLPNYIYARKRDIPKPIKKVMGILERNGKKGEGSLAYVLGCFIASLFPLSSSIPAILVLAFSDALSTMVGKSNKNSEKKTIEGSIVFFLSSMAILNFFMSPLKSLLIALLSSSLEFFSKEDNLLIPPFVAFMVYFIPI